MIWCHVLQIFSPGMTCFPFSRQCLSKSICFNFDEVSLSFFFFIVMFFGIGCLYNWGFPGGSDGKESTWIAGNPGSIPGLGRSLEKRMDIHSSILAWRILWTEEPGGLQSMGVTKSQTRLSLFIIIIELPRWH